MISSNYQVRPALSNDKHEIANMMFFERHVHRHLDWKHPTDWLGSPLYWVLERNARIMAVLACPQDQRKEITWLRLFTHVDQCPTEEAWNILWENAKEDLKARGNIKISAITLQNWMQSLLKESGFVNDEKILMMSWEEKESPEYILPEGVNIRLMEEDDLPDVVKVDKDAFAPLWQNQLSMLEQAYAHAAFPSVALFEDEIVGYQISTKSPFGAHLARLAVHSKVQRRGIASALIGHLLTEVLAQDISQVSVNTQSKNERSIALYEKNGFKHTEEEYPLYSFQIAGNNKEEL